MVVRQQQDSSERRQRGLRLSGDSIEQVSAHLLDLDGREQSLEHGAHQPQLRQLRAFSRLLESVQHELVSVAFSPHTIRSPEVGSGILHQELCRCCAATS